MIHNVSKFVWCIHNLQKELTSAVNPDDNHPSRFPLTLGETGLDFPNPNLSN